VASFKDQLRDDITTALKAGDSLRVGTLRMLSAAATNREKELLHELSDDEFRDVAAKEMKKRTESIEAFEAAGRVELVDKETAEREILAPYAPAQLSEAEVDAIIDDAFSSTGASAPGDLGKVMGVVMAAARAKGQVDGGMIQRKVKARLDS
jgi:uncharacterized protein YqeY